MATLAMENDIRPAHHESMRLLILGGTWFLGRTLAEQALARDWQVTTFSRGRSGYDVPGTDAIRGDRQNPSDIARLAGTGEWDAVADTSGQVPAVVASSARVIRPRAARYVYLSTVKAYKGWPDEPLTDDSPVYEPTHEGLAVKPGAAEGMAPAVEYGALKATCELAARQWFGDECLILRPGVVLGPYEYAGRLPWLLKRMRRGGQVLAAGDPLRPIQPVDVRDLAAFVLRAVEAGLSGAMNVTAPVGHAAYGEMLAACREVTGAAAELVWVDDEWLSAQDVTLWTEIPLWRTAAGAWTVCSARAQAAGLSCRPLRETVAETWTWMQHDEPMPHERAAEIGIDPAKERLLLDMWFKGSGSFKDRAGG
jgi:nucleoside-diphosphate-sugar epimerase